MKYLENRHLQLINILHVYQQGKTELIKAKPKDVAIITNEVIKSDEKHG